MLESAGASFLTGARATVERHRECVLAYDVPFLVNEPRMEAHLLSRHLARALKTK